MNKARLFLIAAGAVCAVIALFDTTINWYKVAFFGFISLTNLVDEYKENN